MKIYDITKTYEIENPDLEKGYLRVDNRVVAYHPYQPKIVEIGHYETIKEYANGGKDVKWVVDIQGQEEKEAYEETEEVEVYVPYTEKELADKRIFELKQELSKTDYQAIKFAEGLLTESEYAPIKVQRQGWRAEINSLQERYGV